MIREMINEEDFREPWNAYRVHADQGGWEFLPDPSHPPREVTLEIPEDSQTAEDVYLALVHVGIPFTSVGVDRLSQMRATLYWDPTRYERLEGEADVIGLLACWHRAD